jgi:hypothetical protein
MTTYDEGRVDRQTNVVTGCHSCGTSRTRLWPWTDRLIAYCEMCQPFAGEPTTDWETA